jgi:hypothetical protein
LETVHEFSAAVLLELVGLNHVSNVSAGGDAVCSANHELDIGLGRFSL